MSKKSGSEFQWMDDETELLNILMTAQFVKAWKVWTESVRSKYEDILKLMHEALPDSPDHRKQLTIHDVL